MKRVRAVISGRVQGVWFRGWTIQEANARGLDGWVRNRRDSSVEAVFEGEDAAVDDMLRACHDGPPAARVFEVEVFPHDETIEPGFRYVPNL
jgi:acylphosphatase